MAALTCSNCGQGIDPGDDSCGWCGSPLPRQRTAPVQQPSPDDDDPFAAGVRLRLPDGRVIALQPGDRLVVGRDQELSPLASLCGDNISRRHAVITVTPGGTYLADTDSTNGTYLNGGKIKAGQDYRLSGQAAVSFGSDPPLRIDVEVDEW